MVVLLLGSARLNRHIRIPFTIREKNTMTERAMTAAKSTRLSAENQNGTIMSAFAKLHNTYSSLLWCPKLYLLVKKKVKFWQQKSTIELLMSIIPKTKRTSYVHVPKLWHLFIIQLNFVESRVYYLLN